MSAGLLVFVMLTAVAVALMSARRLMALSIEQFAHERGLTDLTQAQQHERYRAELAGDDSLPIRLGPVWRDLAARRQLRRLVLPLGGLTLGVLVPIGIVVAGLVRQAHG